MTEPWEIVLWWELRRIPYNILLLFVGLLTLYAVELIAPHSPMVAVSVEDPDVLLPSIALFALGANACYTLGWLTEFYAGRRGQVRPVSLRKKRFWQGVVFSIFVTIAPAVLLPVYGPSFGSGWMS